MASLADIARILARLAWAAVGIALVVVLLVDVRPAVQSWGAMPQQITDLTAEVEAIPDQVIGQVLPVAQVEIQATREEILAEVDKQATGLRGDIFPRVDRSLGLIDRRTNDALEMVDARTKDVIAQVAGVRADLAPVLTQSTALVKDAQDSLDDLYPDLKATVESATVTVTSIAVASEAVRDSAPQVAASFVGIGKSADGIAADVHTATSDFVRPKTFWGKLKSIFETVGKVAARLI